MSRKPTTAELEQRLRLEADREIALPRSFRSRLRERLATSAAADEPAALPRRAKWPAGVTAAAAVVAVATVATVLVPRPAPSGGEAEVAAALGAGVHNSLSRRPEAIARAGEQRLADEARRLLADARRATSPLLAPWRSP